MENLNKLYDLTLKIKSIIHKSHFKKNDARLAYFENLYSIINEFYAGKVFFRIAQEIKNGSIKFDQSIAPLQPHILRVYEIADHPLLANGYHNDLNRRLFIDTFTNFETTISFCFEEIISDDEMGKIVVDLNSRIIKITKDLPDENKDLLLNELKKNTFIPLSRKFRYLSKLKTNCYPADIKSDLAFIEFCSKLRNCVSHSAGYYKGNDFQYEFENVMFIFKNDAFLDMQGLNEFVFLKINERLSNIINNLNACLEHIGFIQYPDDGF
ncbi:hypothetical protein [Flavobacterium collinsii]|uniref:Uncharacterized protein n=1 Tax=Flavobacterium collinsii TaxID=1114861 RepID=A0A9W4THL8_9FLAO|nr:hypothetical protein [Flavobacterium collinsii]CAI2768167.1 conserved protein of unknown function [Flavobacterium collinsii]